jgi:hypothetical protein
MRGALVHGLICPHRPTRRPACAWRTRRLPCRLTTLPDTIGRLLLLRRLDIG